MGLLDNESIPRRKMILFFVIDTSGSMIGKKIGSVNDAIENVLPMIGEISDENPDAEIILTTSRRTPNEFLAQLQQHDCAEKLQIFPVEQTPQGWIFEEMQKAR